MSRWKWILQRLYPHVLEVERENGSVFSVRVEYPWVPPTCFHCKEVGHIIKNCLLLPPPSANAMPHTTSSFKTQVPQRPAPSLACFHCKEVGHLMRNCPKANQQWTPIPNKSRKISRSSLDASASGLGVAILMAYPKVSTTPQATHTPHVPSPSVEVINHGGATSPEKNTMISTPSVSSTSEVNVILAANNSPEDAMAIDYLRKVNKLALIFHSPL